MRKVISTSHIVCENIYSDKEGSYLRITRIPASSEILKDLEAAISGEESCVYKYFDDEMESTSSDLILPIYIVDGKEFVDKNDKLVPVEIVVGYYCDIFGDGEDCGFAETQIKLIDGKY